MRVGLVGCVKGKAASSRPASELYTSPLFAGRRRYVERSCDRWFILSARHGLVAPSRVIEPYDESLVDASRDRRRDWASLVLKQLTTNLGGLATHTFEVHAGSAYSDFGLVDGLRERGALVECPAGGRSIGKLLAFYAAPADGTIAAQASPAGRKPKPAMADEPLRRYLAGSTGPVSLTFREIEKIIGRALPASARNHRAWWANSPSRPLARQWLAAGWRLHFVDLSTERLGLHS